MASGMMPPLRPRVSRSSEPHAKVRQSNVTGPLIYAGIDEAGYGPRLGPLCVAQSVFEVKDWAPGDDVPDLWRRLERIVCSTIAQSRDGRLPINDSKRLKLANGSASRHPLTHLERAVLAFAARGGAPPASDAALFETLGARIDAAPWHAGEPHPLPCSTTPDHVRLLAGSLARECDACGVRLLDLRCHTLDAGAFNEGVARLGSKARVSFGLVGALLNRVWRSEACASAGGGVGGVGGVEGVEEMGGGGGGPRVVIDRQGGRISYAGALKRVLGDEAEIIIHEERPVRSAYEVRGLGPSAPRRMWVRFEVDSEARHFPVALASMTAKLVRELAMARFNRYWSERFEELKPTAGYALDAARWLRDVEGRISPEERARIVRLA